MNSSNGILEIWQYYSNDIKNAKQREGLIGRTKFKRNSMTDPLGS